MTRPRKLVQGRLTLVLISASAMLVLTAAIVGLAYVFFSPPDGPPIATFDIRSGEPFELPFAANGADLRVWLEMGCDDCSLPVDGSMRLSSNGRAIEAVQISAGSTKRGGWSGGTHSISEVELLDADAQPPGAQLVLQGTLTVYGGRDFFAHEVKAEAPPPKVRVFRLIVTN